MKKIVLFIGVLTLNLFSGDKNNPLPLFLQILSRYYNLKHEEILPIDTFYHELGHAIEGILYNNNINLCNSMSENYFMYFFERCNGESGSYFGGKLKDPMSSVKRTLAGGAIVKIIQYQTPEEIIEAMGGGDIACEGDIHSAKCYIEDYFIKKIGDTDKTFFDVLIQEKEDEFVINMEEAQKNSSIIENDKFLSLLKKDVIAKIMRNPFLLGRDDKGREKIAEYIGNFIAIEMQKEIEKFKQFEIPIKELIAKHGIGANGGHVYWNGVEMTREFVESCQKNNIKIKVPVYLQEISIDSMNQNLIEYNLKNKEFIESMEKSISLSPVLNSLQEQYLKITGKKIEKLNKIAFSYNNFISYQNGFNYLINNGQNAFSINAFQKNMYQVYPSPKQRLLDQIKQNNLYLNKFSQYLNKKINFYMS